MGRAPCCSKVGLHRGPWTPREDTLLTKYIQTHGEGHWRSLPKKAGLLRCGKSCRLRWMNYLRPDIKRGNISPDEDDLIIRLHSLLGNRWSLIAGRLPGRTDNEIKNYWNTHLGKRQKNNQRSNNHKKSSFVGPTTIQESKKRSKITSKKNNTKKQKTMKPNVVEGEKIKVHQPKPVRVTSLMSIPRNESFESSNYSTVHSGGSSSLDHSLPSDDHLHDHHQDHEGGFEFANWSNVVVDGVGFFVGSDDDHHDNLINGPDFECQSSLPGPTTDNKTLEKLYEEYLELLKTEDDQDHQIQLDSFAESLFI